MKKLYVENFSFHMTEPELRALFEPYGTIESASLAPNRDSGRSRGFGFVSMTNDDEAKKAIAALNGKGSGGRALTVNVARPQTQRTGFLEGGRRDRGSRQRPGTLVKTCTARRLRKVVQAASNDDMATVVCDKCGQRFAIHNGGGAPDAQLTEKQAVWLQDRLVWDHIQERKHHATIELPKLQ